MKPTISIVTAAVLLAIVASAVPTAAQREPGTAEVLQVGANSDFAPFEYRNKAGEAEGYTIDLMKAVAREMNLDVLISPGLWSRVLNDLESGKLDALTGVLYSPERAALFDFSIPHTVISYTIFVRRDSEVKLPQDLVGKEVIVVRDVYAHEWLRQNDFTPNIIAVDRPEQALRLLASGQHDCAVLIRLHGLELMRTLKIENLKTVGPPVLTQKLAFAVRKGNAGLLAKLNEGLYLLQTSGGYDRLYLKWFSVYEQRRLLDRALRTGKLFAGPLLLLALLAALWIWSLQRVVNKKTRVLQEREQLLTHIVEGTPAAVLVGDQQRRITRWNKACEKLTGIAPEQVLGKNFQGGAETTANALLLSALGDQLHGDKGPMGYRRFTHRSSLVEGAEETEVFIPGLGKNGLWLYGTVAPFFDKNGRSLGSVETWQDFTDRRQLENRLVHTRKMEALGRVAGSIAHDFNNFLQAILAYVDTAASGRPEGSEGSEALSSARETILRARSLVREIMLFSRRDLAEPTAIRLAPVVRRCLQAVRATLPQGLDLREDLRSDSTAMADAVHVEQVVLNLCNNALQAMRASGGQLTVSLEDVRLHQASEMEGVEWLQGPFLRLTVADTGPGIPNEVISRIFEPFFTTRKQQGGNGMGLAIVHGIVKGYGGTIRATNRTGGGALFEVFWPAVSAEQLETPC
jgi:two-component system sensor histidine kinase EvgS